MRPQTANMKSVNYLQFIYSALKNDGVSEHRIHKFLSCSNETFFEAGSNILLQGSVPNTFNFIIEGVVCASNKFANGSLNVINIHGPGSWFAESQVLHSTPSLFTYFCLYPVKVLSVPLSQAHDIFENDIGFMRYLARLIAWRDAQHSEALTTLKIGIPALRIAVGLVLFAEAFIGNCKHLPMENQSLSIKIPLKQSLLASLLNVSRSVFSECVQHLASAKLVKLNYASLELLSVPCWGRFIQRHRLGQRTDNKTSIHDLIKELCTTTLPQ